jgi:TPR repeat protein
MTTTAFPGAETLLGSAGGRKIAEGDAGYADYDEHGGERGDASGHDPEAKALLRRYLSEVHSFRKMGNHALRNLEARLATMPPHPARDNAADGDELPAARPGQTSQLIRPSLSTSHRHQQAQQRRQDPSLQQRLHELSAYLHADLSREHTDAVHAPRPPRVDAAAPRRSAAASGPHKIPTLPVLDRAWFEERFAAMRTSMDRLTEQLPLKRIEALEAQFRELMERLTARETARDPRPMDASLKKLAAYLADSRQWAVANEKRVKGLEDKLDRLSRLVAQSHAAISATAKGLELVARGTGDGLARKTADIVIAGIGQQIEARDPAERLDQLGREVAHLTAQSRHIARSAEDRLEQIQTALKENGKPAAPPGAAPAVAPVKPPGLPPGAVAPAAKPAASGSSSHDELESYLKEPIELDDDDYDSDMIAAAQHAAQLADGPAPNAPTQKEPVRYQIPYGEFLPDENGPPSRLGMIIAVVILALAGATMLFLKWKEWSLIEPKPAVSVGERHIPAPTSTAKQGRLPIAIGERSGEPRETESAALSAAGPMGVPVVTGSTPAAPLLGTRPLELWVASRAPDASQVQAAPSQANAEAVPTPAEASFREAAVKGDLHAQLSVGQGYLSGEHHDGKLAAPDPVTGLRWVRRSAERGHAPAQYKLATLYELGHGTPRDLTAAEEWYEKAASSGHVKAMHNLAVLAASQNGKSANYVTAARWFKEAAGYGLVDSQFNLGVLYDRGLGVERDPVAAYRWFSLAAREQDEKARQKRDEVARLLTVSQRQEADRLVAQWTSKQRSAEVNRPAPEMPAAESGKAEKPIPVRAVPTTSAAVVSAAWRTDLTPTIRPAPGSASLVAEAQRLLRQRGYDPGPADGLAGPRTQSAIRSFQRSAGLPETGEVSTALIVKMAFLPL